MHSPGQLQEGAAHKFSTISRKHEHLCSWDNANASRLRARQSKLFCFLSRELLIKETYNSGPEQEEVKIQARLFHGEGFHIALQRQYLRNRFSKV